MPQPGLDRRADLRPGRGLEPLRILGSFRRGRRRSVRGARGSIGPILACCAAAGAGTREPDPTRETRHDGETSIPSLLVPIAGLRSEDLAAKFARPRRRALDDARSVPIPRPPAPATPLSP